MDPSVLDTLALARANWNKNYRHHGGVSAAVRCWLGTARLKSMADLCEVADGESLDCISCSVIPLLTSLWAHLTRRAVWESQSRFIIGDCSGGFARNHRLTPKAEVWPMINEFHGDKVDLLMSRRATSAFVLVSDDDVFWLDSTPWKWAMEQFARDPNLAVASLVPRERFTWTINGREYQPMGSYNLIIRRSIWTREKLSLRPLPIPSPSAASHNGHYDTADFANCELLKRGYNIAIAPPEVRSRMVAFKALSSGLLVLQKDPAVRQKENAGHSMVDLLRCARIARGLAGVIASLNWGERRPLVPEPLLAEFERLALNKLPWAERNAVFCEVDTAIARIKTAALKPQQDRAVAPPERRQPVKPSTAV